MKEIIKKEYALIPREIDRFSMEVYGILTDTCHLNKKDALRHRLAMEEIMLSWMAFDPAGSVTFQLVKRGRKVDLSLTLQGTGGAIPCNPLEEEDGGALNESILANLGIAWMHQFVDGENCVSTRITWKKERPMLRILIALAAAVATILILKLQPAWVSGALLDNAVNPLFQAFLTALTAVVGPLMFLTMVEGILGIGNSNNLKTIGKRVCGRYLLISLETALMSLVLIMVFFHLSFGGGGGSDNQARAILDFVLSIIPGDIFSPFVDGNTIQIIFMAMLTGGVMLGMRSRLGEAEKLTRQLNLIVQQIFEMVLWFLPAFIYLSILRIGLSENLSSLTRFITTLLAFVAGLVVMDLFLLVAVKIRTRRPILPFLKAAFPSVMIALLTQSSAATFSEASSNMTDHLGIRKKLVDFGLPIGYILCKPVSTMWMMLLSSTCMIISNIPITPVKMITLILVAVILCVAMPRCRGVPWCATPCCSPSWASPTICWPCSASLNWPSTPWRRQTMCLPFKPSCIFLQDS